MPQMTEGLAFEYASLLAAGTLNADPSQAEAVGVLADLSNALLASPDTSASKRRGWFGWGDRQTSVQAVQRGVYLHGPVGRGKSTVMDLFHASLPAGISRRVHFHAFMIDVHKALVAAREAGKKDPLAEVAANISAGLKVLCFDEFVVTDIADAMILAWLYENIRAQGVTWVVTSNFPPSRLYEGGLQRERFLPFIGLVQETMDVVAVDHSQDYRRLSSGLSNRYFSPQTAQNRARFEESFALVAGNVLEPFEIKLSDSRSLTVDKGSQTARVGAFTFGELFTQPYGAGDFLAIAAALDKVFLSAVPQLTREERNEARRFMTFVDALYESKTDLVLLADAPPDHLYADGDGAFEFKRTASRLMEMQSAGWNARST